MSDRNVTQGRTGTCTHEGISPLLVFQFFKRCQLLNNLATTYMFVVIMATVGRNALLETRHGLMRYRFFAL